MLPDASATAWAADEAEARVAVRVLHVQPGLVREERGDEVTGLGPGRAHEGRVAPAVLRVQVGAPLEQGLDDRDARGMRGLRRHVEMQNWAWPDF